MKPSSHGQRYLLLFLVLATTLAVAVPSARADRGRYRRYRGYSPVGRIVTRDCGPSHYYIQRSSPVGPALAGFFGGLVIGATLGHGSRYPQYAYEDPYCHERFASLDAYYDHARYCRHPRTVRIIEIRTGAPIGSYCYDHGGWVSQGHNDWDAQDYRDDRGRWDDRDGRDYDDGDAPDR